MVMSKEQEFANFFWKSSSDSKDPKVTKTPLQHTYHWETRCIRPNSGAGLSEWASRSAIFPHGVNRDNRGAKTPAGDPTADFVDLLD